MKPFDWSYKNLLYSVGLIFVGGLLAWIVQTGGGAIDVRDIRFQSASGATLSALLYIPRNATSQSPAPGVLAVHGYINSRETQSAYAIELARRGYVVLAMDQRGHGYSDPPAFAEGFGGPAGLQYLRSLAIVDTDQIVLSGHSMGGWTVLSAAVSAPEDYAAVIVSGSSTGTFGVPPGDAGFPRNFGLVFGEFDEFSGTMWQSARGIDIVNSEKLQTQFGISEPVIAGRLYGDIANGTARRLYQPAQTHPSNHITETGVAAVLDWVQATTSAPNAMAPERQVWWLKELGTLISLLGGMLFIFTAGSLLLKSAVFSPLVSSAPKSASLTGTGWWIGAAVFVALSALTYFPFQGFAARITANPWLGQNLTNGFMVWALGNAAISVMLLVLWHFLLGGRAAGNSLVTLGLALPATGRLRYLLLTILLAVATVGGLYLLLAVNHWLFTADFRFWVVAVKLMNTIQLHEFLVYLLPFTLFFIVTGAVLHGQLRGTKGVAGNNSLLRNALLAGSGIFLLLAYQYVPLFLGRGLAIPAQALLTIVALQFVVLLPLTAMISTWFFRLTGRVYAGALINAMFITWLIVAGQATHYAF